jgi:hypothetical protein
MGRLAGSEAAQLPETPESGKLGSAKGTASSKPIKQKFSPGFKEWRSWKLVDPKEQARLREEYEKAPLMEAPSMSFATDKIKKNITTAMSINSDLAKVVHMSGSAFKVAGHQMKITSGFRNTAAQRKAMEELRKDDPAQYEKNYGFSAKNDASTEKWLKGHISRHSTGNALDVSYPSGIKGNKAKQEEFVDSLNSVLQADGDGSYAVAEGHHIHINTGQKAGKMSQASFEKKFNALSAAVPPMSKSNTLNENQNMNNELKGKPKDTVVVLNESKTESTSNSNTQVLSHPSGIDAGQPLKEAMH